MKSESAGGSVRHIPFCLALGLIPDVAQHQRPSSLYLPFNPSFLQCPVLMMPSVIGGHTRTLF